jgi:hypothetical protein
VADTAQRIAPDLAALSAVAHRYAGTEGEREMLHQVRSRMPDPSRARIDGFVAYTSPGFVIGSHAAALLVGGLIGLWWPLLAALLCALVTASLAMEGSGRYSVLRRILPKSASYNLVWKKTSEGSLGTIVVSAPLDTPRWRPERPKWLKRPLQAVFVAAIVLTTVITLRALAEPWGRPTVGMYVGSLGILGVTVALGAVMHRRAAGVHEDASGAAALLELVRRFDSDPPPGLDVWAVFTGCGHAYQNGMHAFLAMRPHQLREPVLVVALADPGRPHLRAVVSEGPLWAQHQRPTGPALVERLRWAGLALPSTDSAGITDARAAMLWGHRALALSGGRGPSTVEDTVRAVEVTEAIGRLYAEDLRRVPDLHPTLRHLLPQPDELADETVSEERPRPEPAHLEPPQRGL